MTPNSVSAEPAAGHFQDIHFRIDRMSEDEWLWTKTRFILDTEAHQIRPQNQTFNGVKNSRPSFFPDRHTNRHRRGVFGGKTKVNSSGMAFVPEIDTHAPPADR